MSGILSEHDASQHLANICYKKAIRPYWLNLSPQIHVRRKMQRVEIRACTERSRADMLRCHPHLVKGTKRFMLIVRNTGKNLRMGTDLRVFPHRILVRAQFQPVDKVWHRP